MPTKPDLEQRRKLLLSRTAAQRESLAMQTILLTGPMASIDSGVHLLGNLRRHPAWIAGVLIAIALVRPRRLVLAVAAARKVSRAWTMMQPIVARFRR